MIPLLFGAHLASKVGGSVLAHVTEPFFAPVTRTFGYIANASAPNMGPDPSDLIELFHRGHLTRTEFTDAMQQCGIAAKPHTADRNWSAYWERVIRMKGPWSHPETVHWLFKMGVLNEAQADKAWKDAGGMSLNDMSYLANSTPSLSPTDLRWGIFTGSWSKDWAVRTLSANGYGEYDNAKTVLDNAPTVSIQQATDLMRRGFYHIGRFREVLARNGITLPDDVMDSFELLKNLPNPSDVVQMAVKDAWDPAVVAKFRYDEDFPQEFQYWMGKLGYGWQEDVTLADGTVIPGETWAKLMWRSHWRNVSPAQAYQMQQRLAPDVAWRWQALFPGVLPWNQGDTMDLLKVNDYAPAFRDRLAAIAYGHLGVRVVKRISGFAGVPVIFEQIKRYDVGNPAPTQESTIKAFGEYQARDQGLAPDDAKLYGDLVQLEYIKERDKVHTVRRLKLDEKAALQQLELYRYGLKLRNATVRTLTDDFSWKEATAQLATTDIDTDERIKCYKLLYTRCRSDYFGGILTRNDAANRLMSAGVDEQVAETNVKCWAMNFTWKRRQLTTDQILSLHCKGLLDYNAAKLRLTNIGWDNPEDVLLLASAQLCIINSQTKAFKQAQLAKKQQAAALAKLIHQQQLAIKAQQKQLEKMTPVSLLDKLAKQGEIGYPWYKSRMTAMGYDASSILLRWESMFPPKDTLSSMETKVKSGEIKIAVFVAFLKTSEYTDDEIRTEVENVLGIAGLSDPSVPPASQPATEGGAETPPIPGQPEPATPAK